VNVNIVTDELEMSLVKRVMDGHAALLNGEILRSEWNDRSLCPRDVFLFISDIRGDESAPFVVVDNRDGECFVEQFSSLDGALFYACDVYIGVANKGTWDYPGAAKDRGNLKRTEPLPCI
jgi:hypothetical protein